MRVFLPAIILAACVGITSAAGEASGIPEFSGLWWHPSLPGPEPLASGPTTVVNRSRTRAGISDYSQLVGDYTNPILKPAAAEVVKRFGEISLAGRVFPSPANQCWPEPGPFIYKNFALEMFQKPDEITLIYDQDHEVRHVRLNQQHPKNLKPSWYGDSIGHYEGDTLVVDTVGIRTDRPYAMIDLYGTPYTPALHMIERYRLIAYDDAKEAIERDKKENMRVAAGMLDPNYRGKYLQVFYTIEDGGVFTTPWSATATFGKGATEWPETVCAENPHVYYDKDETVPEANRLDF
jgi:hypothetical protein